MLFLYAMLLLPDEVEADVTRDVVGVDIGDVRCKSLRNHGILRRILLCELIIAFSLGGEDELCPFSISFLALL